MSNMDEHTTEIESQGLPERIEQILGLMKDRAGCYACPAPLEKDTPYILYRGRMYCLACAATRQYLRGEN